MNSTVQLPMHLGDIDTHLGALSTQSVCQIAISRLTEPLGCGSLAALPPQRAELLLAPVVVVANSEGGYVVVDGVKRIRLAREAGQTSCWCAEIGPQQKAQTIAPLLRFTLNSGRVFDLCEQLAFVQQLNGLVIKRDWFKVAARLGMDGGIVKRWLEIVDLDEATLKAVVAKKVSIETAAALGCVEPQARQGLLDLLGEFVLSVQMQREIVEWIPEIASRDRVSVSGVIAQVRQRANASAEQSRAGAHLHELVRLLRFPLLSAARREWEACARSINPDPTHVHLIPSPSFERARLEIKVQVDNPATVSGVFECLASVAPKVWAQLLSPQG